MRKSQFAASQILAMPNSWAGLHEECFDQAERVVAEILKKPEKLQ